MFEIYLKKFGYLKYISKYRNMSYIYCWFMYIKKWSELYTRISSKCFLLKCMPDMSVTCPVCKYDWIWAWLHWRQRACACAWTWMQACVLLSVSIPQFLIISFLPPAVRLPFTANADLHWPPPGYCLHSENQRTYPVFEVLITQRTIRSWNRIAKTDLIILPL